MNRGFLDTNILIYCFARGDVRLPAARALLNQGVGVISVQSLNEFAHVARRKLRMTWAEAREARDMIMLMCEPPQPLTFELHDRALELADRWELSLHDAMIVAAALKAGCDTLYSEDMHHGLVIDGRVTITNPFAGL